MTGNIGKKVDYQEMLLPRSLIMASHPTEEAQFLALSDALEANYRTAIAHAEGGEAERVVAAYVNIASMLVDEVGIGSIPLMVGAERTPNWWTSLAAVEAAFGQSRRRAMVRAARQQVAAAEASIGSVTLERRAKGWIRQELEQLRVQIEGSELSEKVKKRLIKKLEEMRAELDKPRLDIGRFLTHAAAVAGILGGTSTAIADSTNVHDTIAHWIQVIGDEKEAEGR